MPFELRPYPTPTLRPEDDYLQRAWRTSVYPMARRMGVDIKLPSVSPQPYTALAFEGLLFAQERGKGNAYNAAVLQAFFQRDLDIGSIDVLERIASELGLPSDEFRRALEAGSYREQERRLLRPAYAEAGVAGVPLFIVGDERRLVGLQDRRTLEQAIARAASAPQ